MTEMVKNMDYCPKTELIVGGIGRVSTCDCC
jgi:hypothetical protein